MAFQRSKKNTRWAYLFLLPVIVGMGIFSIVPISLSFAISTFEWVGFMQPTFVGLDNYSTAIKDPEIIRTILNTFRMAIFILPISLIISIVISAALNKKIRFSGVYRVIYYLPVITMPAAIAMVWQYLYNSKYGLINFLIGKVGVEPVAWLGDPDKAWVAIVIMGIWGALGGQILILLAAFQSIPDQLYEAADVDGANGVTKLFKITIPMLSPSIFFLVITGFISQFQLFDPILLMIGRGRGLLTTKTIVYYFYDIAFKIGDKGYGATVAVIIFFVILAFSGIQMLLEKKWVYRS